MLQNQDKMAVKIINYERHFKSTGEPDYFLNEQDDTIRRHALKRFALANGISGMITNGVHKLMNRPYGNFGSDGRLNYVFEIKGWPRDDKMEEYETIFYIKKSGSEEDLKELSDLEEFLLKKGFKRAYQQNECLETDNEKWVKQFD